MHFSLSSSHSAGRPSCRSPRSSSPICVLILLSLMFVSIGLRTKAQTSSQLNPDGIAVTGPTRLQAENVSIQVTDTVKIQVKSVDGLLMPTHPNHPISLDDPRSMRLQLQNAETTLSAEDLSRLLNEYVLPHAKTSVKEISVSFEDGQVHVTGKVHKLVDVPFSADGPVGVTPDGDVRVHFAKITAAGFVHKKMLDWLGIKASSVAGAGRPHSFRVESDDVIFPLHTLFPPPHFTGHLRLLKIEGDRLVQVFGTPRPFAPPPVPAEHYIYFRGGAIQFGRLTMQGVDLELLNKEEGQPLNFSMDNVFAESLAGYLKPTAKRGIVAYIASYAPTEHSKH